MFPYCKVFIDSDMYIDIISYADEKRHSFKRSTQIGDGLVSFCELDINPFVIKIKELLEIPFTIQNYEDIRKAVYNAADVFKDKHEYVHFFMIGALNNIVLQPIVLKDEKEMMEAAVSESEELNRQLMEHLKECIRHFDSIVNLYDIFSFALSLCLDKDNHTDRSVAERVNAFYFRYPDLSSFTIPTGFAIMPTKKGFLDYKKTQQINDAGITDTRELLTAVNTDKSKVSLLPYYHVQSLDEMLFLEFVEMLKQGIQVKRCGLCGKYFVLIDKRKREYCDRDYEGGKTCQEIGPLLRYEQNLQSDEYLRKFETEYNKIYSRFYRADGKLDAEFSGKDMTREEFRSWSRNASKAKTDYRKKLITGDEMLLIVRNEM
jgi:hypothetical protein